jgi:hypothetical protein
VDRALSVCTVQPQRYRLLLQTACVLLFSIHFNFHLPIITTQQWLYMCIIERCCGHHRQQGSIRVRKIQGRSRELTSVGRRRYCTALNQAMSLSGTQSYFGHEVTWLRYSYNDQVCTRRRKVQHFRRRWSLPESASRMLDMPSRM